MSRFKPVLAWSVMLLLLSAAGGEAQSRESLDNLNSDELLSLKKPRQLYSVGSEIELNLRTNELVQLDCNTTAHGPFSCVVFRGAAMVNMVFLDEAGEVMNRGGSSVTKQKGAIRQVGELPYLTIATWAMAGEQLKIQFCIASELEKIHRAYERAKLKESGQWSIQFRNSLLIPVPQLSETERLTGFIQLWSEVKYNFAFFSKCPEVDWDKVLVEYLPKVQKAESVFEYYRLLRHCMALLHDGHTEVFGPSDAPSYQPPFEVRPIDGKAVIVAIVSADKIKKPALKEQLLKANLKLGEQVTEVDGRPVQEILHGELYPYICASTTQALELKAFPMLLKGENQSQVMLTIKEQTGATRKTSLTRATYRFSRPAFPRGVQVKEMADGILYINLPSFSSDEIVKQFEAVLPRIRSGRGLLLDVRHNGGGNSSNGDAIIGYLVDKPFCYSHWKTRQYLPAFRAWGRAEKWHEGDNTIRPRGDKPFLGPVVVLTGPETASAAEDFVVALHGSGRAKVVGEKTLGSTGQPLMISLPGGGSARVCTKWDTYADGREFVGVGVIPDVEVHRTWEGITSGKDEVLEAGILSLQKTLEDKPAGKEVSGSQPKIYFLKDEKAWFQQTKEEAAHQFHTVGTTTTLMLAAKEGAYLDFGEQFAGKGVLFHYDGEKLQLAYWWAEDDHTRRELDARHKEDQRWVSFEERPLFMEWSTKFEKEGDKAKVTFLGRWPSAEMAKKLLDGQKKSEALREQEKAVLLHAKTVREWDEGETTTLPKLTLDEPNDPGLSRLRVDYGLEKLVAGAANEYEKLRRIVKWAHDRWRHSGDNVPSKSDPLTILKEAAAGKRFRCVEYAIVTAACARALGMPSRVLGLKREDVETKESGAGHVVAEVWLEQFNKWIFVDGQWDAIPEKDGIPLNGVEFQDVIAHSVSNLTIRSSSGVDQENYLKWITPYLFYYDFNLDQRFFKDNHSNEQRNAPPGGKIMLVPKGATRPQVFQRKTPIKNCTYISNPRVFYPQMKAETNE